jgi:hypothetical protein
VSARALSTSVKLPAPAGSHVHYVEGGFVQTVHVGLRRWDVRHSTIYLQPKRPAPTPYYGGRRNAGGGGPHASYGIGGGPAMKMGPVAGYQVKVEEHVPGEGIVTRYLHQVAGLEQADDLFSKAVAQLERRAAAWTADWERRHPGERLDD